MSIEQLKNVNSMFNLSLCINNRKFGYCINQFARYILVLIDEFQGIRKIAFASQALKHEQQNGKRSAAKANERCIG